jgi:hypothetical protein
MLESKPCNQAVARTRTLRCRLPNRATKLFLELEPFVAGFQTVQPSRCKNQNPSLQASKLCNQGVTRTRTLCCRLPNRATKLLLEPEPFLAGFQTVQPSCWENHNPLLQASKPCNQAVARTRTLPCRLPNRATKLLREPQPFVAGFQTVRPSSCKNQNPFVAGLFWAQNLWF